MTGPAVVLLYDAMCDESTPARHSATRITARTLTGVRSVDLTRLSRVRLLTFFSYGRVFRSLVISDADGVWLGISSSAGRRAVRRALTRPSGDGLLPRPRVSRAARAFLDGDRPGRLAVHTMLAFLALTVGISGYVGVLLTLGGLVAVGDTNRCRAYYGRMQRHGRKPVPARGTHREYAHVIHDRYWAREFRGAILSAALLFGALVLLDWSVARLTGMRASWWAALAMLLLIVLTPPRVSACHGELEARGLVLHHRVRVDRLVTVRVSEGVTPRLLLTDAFGGRLLLDPRVLVANPVLWHQLDQGARQSVERGTLRSGMPVLERLGRRIDGEVCRGILRRSGMERAPAPKGSRVSSWCRLLLRRRGVRAAGARP
ncbi:hypothetical protein [Streptomyces sp. NPDC046909]|uniref:hypothetical protein n=1 Tax=Streptomyces sp. NPDC046909 TaxID=3155617 RepID=UPI0033F7D2F3